MNPRSLVASHLRDGSLVELVPGRLLSVPLYWQHTRLQMPMLERLTRAVVAAARSSLGGGGAGRPIKGRRMPLIRGSS
jgi:LysR family transcriptional regulator, chromosome initiation inhibitor